jgi:hypothetical protein
MKRPWIMLVALVVTLGSLWLALTLGSIGFDVRRYAQHERRLQKVMREPEATVERLTKGFENEGTMLVATPAGPGETERVIAGQGAEKPEFRAKESELRAKAAELRAKAARYPTMRVFATKDMLYFVFFDRDRLMRDFTLVSR